MTHDPHNPPPDDDEHKEPIKRRPIERLRSGTTGRALIDDREIAPGLERLKAAYRDHHHR